METIADLMNLFIERAYPYTVALLVSATWAWLCLPFPETENLISSTLSVSGIFIGFLAASKAIFIAMKSPVIDDLKKSGYIHDLISYINQAVWLNLAFCVWNVIGFFVERSEFWYAPLWLFFAVAALMAFFRVTNIMLKVFKYA